MGILFISHSSRNNSQAVEVRDWLRERGWRETFLDLDPEHGLAPGQRWQEELKKAGERCSAVVVLVSPEWLASKWCQVEFLLASQLGKRIFGVIIAATPFAEMPQELTAHYQLVDVSDPALRDEGFERLRFGLKRAGLDPKDFPWPPPEEPTRQAYRGLRSLEEEDAGIFFGRDAAITRGLDDLRRIRAGEPKRMLVILGASGAGKSSFLKAGLLARLRRDEENFLVLPVMRPERAAVTGPRGLLRSFGLSARPANGDLRTCLAELQRPVVERLRRHGAAARESYEGRPPTLILPIDQAEELFASENTEGVEALDLLNAAFGASSDLVAVLTIRSDSFSRIQNEPRLAELARLPFDLPALTPGAFKEVIEGPGRLAKPEIQIEPALTERLMADLDAKDALPLLAFTLERLVAEYGKAGKLGLREFVEDLGGLEGAIEKAVEAALGAASDDPALPKERGEIEQLARRAFLPWLVSVDAVDTPAKRRVAAASELPAEASGLIRHLVSQRLLVSDLRDGETTVEVSHESVLRHWRALTVWIAEERDALRTLSAVQAAAKEWLLQEDPDSAKSEIWLVHRGERLHTAERLLRQRDYSRLLGNAGADYLAACRARADAESRAAQQSLAREQKHLERQRRLQRRATVALLLVAVAVAIFAAVAMKQARQASRQLSLVLADYAGKALQLGYYERSARLAALAAREGLLNVADPTAAPTLAAAAQESSLVMEVRGHRRSGQGLVASADGTLLLTWGEDEVAQVWAMATGAAVASMRHEGGVQGAMFDPTGRQALSWGADGFTRVWNATTGVEIAALRQEKTVYQARFSPSGEKVLSCSGDGTVLLWEAATGVQIAAWTQGRGLPSSAIFDAAGQRVLSWGADGTVQVRSAVSGAEIARFKHEGASVAAAEFDRSGTKVLSRGMAPTAAVWNAATGARTAELEHERALAGAKFDSAGNRVLSWSFYDGVMRIWNAATGLRIAELQHEHTEHIRGDATFDASGERVLSWCNSGEVRVWATDTGAVIATTKHQQEVNGAIFDPSGELVLSWGADGVAQVWNAATGAQISASRHPGKVIGAVFDEMGERVLSWSDDGAVVVWDSATGIAIRRSHHESEVKGASFDASGQRVLSWSSDGVVRLWQIAAGTEHAARVHQKSKFRRAIFDSKGEYVLSWDLDSRKAQLWSSSTGTLVDIKQKMIDAVFADADERVLSWNFWRDGGIAQVWDAATGAEIASMKHDDAGVSDAIFDASGKRVLSWDWGGNARIWDAATGVQLAAARIKGRVRGAALNTSFTRAVCWGEGKSALLWEPSTGKKIADLKHEDRVWRVTFDASGERLLSLGGDKTARVWDALTGSEIAKSQGTTQIYGTFFDPPGERVLSWDEGWDEGGSVWVWNASTGAILAEAEKRPAYGSPRAVFEPSGDRVLSWGDDGFVRVWDASTGAELAASKHEGGISEASFDSAGERVLSWSKDGVVRVWSAATGAVIAFSRHEGGVGGAAFDDSGKRVISWGSDRVVKVWDAATGIVIVASRQDGAVAKVKHNVPKGRLSSWSEESGIVHGWDVSWSIPRSSNRALIDETCDRKLQGAETSLDQPFFNGRGEWITHDSVRRISRADADFAPILRDFIGEDVCTSQSWLQAIGSVGN